MNDDSQSPTPTHYTAITDQILSEMDRDLSFHECGVAEPVALSHEQIETFNREGFLSPIPLFGAHEISDIRSYFDDLLAHVLAEGDNQYSISSAHQRHGRVHDLLCHPQITQIVGDLLGDRFVGWGSHFFCKMPGDGKAVAWHQDASYWPLTPSRTVTVWLAVDAADRENGCMRFLNGSHHDGHLTWRSSRPEEHNILNQTVDNVEQYGEPVDNLLRAGEISLHSDLLLHGSEANISNRRRCGLTLRYAPVEVRATQGWNAKGVLLSGVDHEKHWGNPERPD